MTSPCSTTAAVLSFVNCTIIFLPHHQATCNLSEFTFIPYGQLVTKCYSSLTSSPSSAFLTLLINTVFSGNGPLCERWLTTLPFRCTNTFTIMWSDLNHYLTRYGFRAHTFVPSEAPHCPFFFRPVGGRCLNANPGPRCLPSLHAEQGTQ